MVELHYQAFLSHNSADKPAVEELARRLDQAGIACWLDKWNLIPGEAWRPALERGIKQSETCLIFVGASGFGPWHNEEMDLAIREGVERVAHPLRVIPVLLPGGQKVAVAELPGFLKGKTWVEFSQSLDETEAFRRLVSGVRGIEPGPAPELVSLVDRCPYVGLRPFRTEEAPFFFGREGTVCQLLARLGNWFGTRDERRFLAVLGPSGSGKSSVVTAGLLPALERGGLPGSDRWLYISCKPGPNPWESLQVTLGSHPEIRIHLPAIVDQVTRSGDESARLHLAGRYTFNQPDDQRRLVVFLDQFEEVFTYTRRENGQPSRDPLAGCLGQDRRLFIDNLLRAVREEQSRVVVIIALRADFYGHCAALPALRAVVSDNQVLLGPMSRDELRDAIVCPGQRCGMELEPALVERLLDDMEHQPGALPFLQHTLEQLWKVREGRRLTRAAYDAMGSLDGAVDRYAEGYFQSLQPDQQKLLRHIFLDLVQLGEGAADTKRRRVLRDLPNSQSGDLHLFIKDLADRNLVTTSQPLSETSAGGTAADVEVELSHEALLRGWKTFRQWIDTSRDHLRLKDRLEEAAKQWKQHSHDDYLWRGGHLAAAEDELFGADVPLSDDAQSFLAASKALREATNTAAKRESRARLLRAYAVAAGMLVLFLVTLAGLYVTREGIREAQQRQGIDQRGFEYGNRLVSRGGVLGEGILTLVSAADVHLRSGSSELDISSGRLDRNRMEFDRLQDLSQQETNELASLAEKCETLTQTVNDLKNALADISERTSQGLSLVAELQATTPELARRGKDLLQRSTGQSAELLQQALDTVERTSRLGTSVVHTLQQVAAGVSPAAARCGVGEAAITKLRLRLTEGERSAATTASELAKTGNTLAQAATKSLSGRGDSPVHLRCRATGRADERGGQHCRPPKGEIGKGLLRSVRL